MILAGVEKRNASFSNQHEGENRFSRLTRSGVGGLRLGFVGLLIPAESPGGMGSEKPKKSSSLSDFWRTWDSNLLNSE